ncbi:MAG: hypothetical protein NC037_05305 [Bacteroides sp.]|nr:hypothetical protein [Bacillota bacterium]MCM1394184.1 hypothetical protein [[Eubacterium] siraeum]MCM1455923.1 hypothetical protein [Bacteroides sp.]
MSVISFFSYKGGSGRTTTTLNTLYYLIQEKRPKRNSPLIIVDADTESYGMSMLIKNSASNYDAEVSLQGLAVRASSATFNYNGNSKDWTSYPKLNEYFVPVGHYFTKDIDNDAVLLLRSDVTPNEQYLRWSTVFSMNSQSHSENKNLSAALDIMERCDCTVVFDTPSGTQDMATFSLDNSNLIVCCMRPSVQFEIGTRLCFEKLMINWAQERNEKMIIFCPSAVPFKEIKIDSQLYPAYYKDTVFSEFRAEMDTKANDTRGVVELIWEMQDGTVPGIPEVDRFKWQECCLAKLGGVTEDEIMAKEKYQKLAKLIVKYS